MTKNLALFFGLGIFFLSCASSPNAPSEIDLAVQGDEFQIAVEVIKNGQRGANPVYPPRNAVSLFLDLGLLEHYSGNYRESSIHLQEAERLIEEAYTKSVSESVASYILNDNIKEYPGEDYEDIYLNVFNALNYYHNGNLEGAMVEIRKISMSSGKLDMLSRKYENRRQGVSEWILDQLRAIGFFANPAFPPGQAVNFNNSALARYLAFLFYLGDGKPDDARIEFEQLAEAFASNPNIYRNPLPASASAAMDVPPEKARLDVIAFTGLSPVKEEASIQGFFPFFRNPGLQLPVFKLPKFSGRNSVINRIEITVNSTADCIYTFTLELLEDMGAVMEETYNARFSNLFFKTYARTLLKYAAADASASRLGGRGSSINSLLSAIMTKAAVDSSESADIRMSRYLPDKAYIGGIDLEPGTYTVTARYFSGARAVAVDERRDVAVRPGVLNLIELVNLK